MDAVRDEFDIPIIGVIVPGARAAVEATANGEIGVVGTDATVKSGTYTKVIHQMDPNIHVREKACPLFVPLVEEGFKEHVVTEEVIEYYLESLKHTEIDAMILGCTHYPLLRSKIRSYMGERIQIVNPPMRPPWISNGFFRVKIWKMTGKRAQVANMNFMSAMRRKSL